MKKNNKTKYLIIILFLIIISSLTIAFAFTDKILNLKGTVTVYKKGKLIIEEITKIESNLDNNNDGLILNDGNLNINLSFTFTKRGEHTYNETYLITLFNDSHNDYLFTGFNLEPEINYVGGTNEDATATISYEYVNIEESNLSLTENTIPSNERRYLAVKLTIYVGSNKSNVTIDVTGNSEIYTTVDNTGTFYGYLDPSNQVMDLQNKIRDCFTFKVLNTYKTAKSFSIKSGNTNFQFVNNNGGNLDNFSINAPLEEDPENNIMEYSACIKAKDSALFLNDTEKTSVIIIEPNSQNSIGSLDVKVIKVIAKDEEKVHIGNVSFEPIKFNSETNSLKVKATWEHLPDESEKSTSIKNYYINLYQEGNNNPIYTFTVPGDATINDYQFELNSSNYLNENDMVNNNKNYYIKVYAIDEAGNSGQNECNNNNNYCVKSNITSLKYKYSITINSTGSRVKFIDNKTTDTIYLNETYANEIKNTSNDYNLNSTITLSMNNTNLDKTKYTFGLNSGSSDQGTLKINENVINNNITINASTTSSGTCLVEGTKIRLYNNTYKNIEDITYDDLLLSINHDTGKITYNYPIWIETKGEALEYQKTTFSDGTILKTTGNHGIFSTDKNEYVSVLNRKDFHIGTNVIKINKDNKIVKVQVIKIETIIEKVNYYHVSSTYYHNVIANDLLTTDALLVVSNMFPFNNDLTWTSERESFLKQNDLFKYEYWSNVFPSHIFKGFRMEEAKILYNKGLLDINVFNEILNNKMVSPNKYPNGKNKWIITTSDNINNFTNKHYMEGTYYKLPYPRKEKNKKFIGWYNCSNNKIYQPNNKIEVIYSMYFIALYQ